MNMLCLQHGSELYVITFFGMKLCANHGLIVAVTSPQSLLENPGDAMARPSARVWLILTQLRTVLGIGLGLAFIGKLDSCKLDPVFDLILSIDL